MKPDEGSFKWGVTTSQSYFPKDNNEFFEGHEENMLDWIAPYSRTDTLESTLRGFLGRMLFSGGGNPERDTLIARPATTLSVRLCALSVTAIRMSLSAAAPRTALSRSRWQASRT